MNGIIKLVGVVITVLCPAFFGFSRARSKRNYIERLRTVDSALLSAANLLKYGNLSRRKLLETAFYRVEGFVFGEKPEISDPDMSEELSEALNGFLTEFGSGDKTAEQARINGIRHTLLEELDRQKEEYLKSGKLWRTIGVCSGLALGIILI